MGLIQLRIDSSYPTFILPVFVIMAVGMALVFVPLGNTSLTGVSDHDARVASAMLNTTQQVGASLGVALLNTVFTNATASYIQTHRPSGAVGCADDESPRPQATAAHADRRRDPFAGAGLGHGAHRRALAQGRQR